MFFFLNIIWLAASNIIFLNDLRQYIDIEIPSFDGNQIQEIRSFVVFVLDYKIHR